MYGSNYYGQVYYGQGPAIGTTYITHTVDATVVSTATITLQILINHAISATVVTTATITRTVWRTLEATALTTTGSILSSIVEALNVRRTTTKLVTLLNTTRNLLPSRSTSSINLEKTTKEQ